MKVMIGCPIRDRAWILEDYLKSILNLKFPKEDIGLCFILNDSTDETEDMLIQFANQFINTYDYIRVIENNLNQIKDARIPSVRQQIYSTLSIQRNLLLQKAREEEADYLFSVDSDILFEPETLNKLIACDRDIVSAQIWNDIGGTYPNVMMYNDKGKLRHYKNFPRDEIFQCDMTGAIYLISKEVLQETDVEYQYHMLGEDIFFCERAQENGFEIWCNPLVKCKHIMTKEMLKDDDPKRML